MIISHRYKYIFLKTNKTAGTSIEIALSKFCGPNDIITKISPPDEVTRKNLGYPGPQNFLTVKGHKLINHMPAYALHKLVPKQMWDSYYKFCVERNPWDRLVSLYFWIYKSEPRPTFSEFLRSEEPHRLIKKGRDLYSIEGVVAVDKICLYEDLENELETIRRRLGIPESLTLPRAKASFRNKKAHYSDFYSEEDQALVHEMFAAEIDKLNYKFQRPPTN